MFGGQSSRVEYAAHAEYGYLRHTRIESWTWIFVGPTNDLKRAKSSGLVSLSVFAHDDDSIRPWISSMAAATSPQFAAFHTVGGMEPKHECVRGIGVDLILASFTPKAARFAYFRPSSTYSL